MSEQERRVPHTLTGILQLAMDQIRDDETAQLTSHELDPERKAYLEEVFKSMTVDVIKEFENALVILHDDNASIDNKEEALTLVRDHICQIDFANSFLKLGGDRLLLDYAKHPSLRLRKQAISIIAEISQNNPTSQQKFLEAEAVHLFVGYLTEPEELARAAIYALSAIVRNYEPALAKFIEIGGIRALVTCMQRNEENVFIKAAFLVAATANEHDSLRDEYVKEEAVPYLVDCLDPVTDYEVKIETCLFALSSLSKSKLFKLDTNLKSSLQKKLLEIIQKCEPLPQCDEMVEYAKTIINAL